MFSGIVEECAAGGYGEKTKKMYTLLSSVRSNELK